MTNDIDDELNDLVIPDRAKPDTAKRVNFKQAVEAVCRKVESLFMPGTNHLSVVTDMLRPLAAGAKRGRLRRSRERRSHKPINKFQKRK